MTSSDPTQDKSASARSSNVTDALKANTAHSSASADANTFLDGIGSAPRIVREDGSVASYAIGMSLAKMKGAMLSTPDGAILGFPLRSDIEHITSDLASFGKTSAIIESAVDEFECLFLLREPATGDAAAEIADAYLTLTGRDLRKETIAVPRLNGADYSDPRHAVAAEAGFPDRVTHGEALSLLGKLAAANCEGEQVESRQDTDGAGPAVKPEVTLAPVEGGAPARSASAEPFKLNDAEFVGGDLPASVLDLPLKIGFGRSRDDKRWPAKAISFEQFLSVLTFHKEGDKDGPAFIQGEAIKNDRKARAISGLYVVGLDVDSGIKLDWVTHRIQHDLNLTSIIYTTHSHLSKQTLILQSSFQKYAKKRKLPLEPTSEAMRQYMMDEKNWEKWVVDSIEVEDEAKHEAEGIVYVLNHAPIPKFRIIFPLLEPYIISKQKGLNQSDAIDRWKGKLLGLSKTIGLPIDESCLDPSRLFYLPRHKKGAGFSIFVTSGAALNFDNVIEIERKRDNGPIEDDVFAAAAAELGAKHGLSIEGFNLKFWAKHNAHQFDICKLFADKMPERIRHETSNDKFEVECPFDDNHSNAGDAEDRACYVISAHADNSDSPFTWGCQHASCKGRDRLDFVAKAVNDQWFTTADLEDPSHMIFTVEDEVEVKTAKTPESIVEEQIAEVGKLTDLKSAPRLELEKILQTAIDGGLQKSDVKTISAAMGDARNGAQNFKPALRNGFIENKIKAREKAEKDRNAKAQEAEAKAAEKIVGFKLPPPWVVRDGKAGFLDDDRRFIPQCDAFRVVNQASDQERGNRTMLIEFKHPAGGTAQYEIARESLHGSPVALCAGLEGSGFWILATKSAREKFIELLSDIRAKEQHLRATLAGWHRWKDNLTYLSPAGDAWDIKGERKDVSLADSMRIAPADGTLEGWKAAAALAVKENWLCILGLCSGFIGPLIALCDMGALFILISGPSGDGKTTALELGASPWGDPNFDHDAGVIWSLNATPAAAETLAKRGNGAGFFFDEMKHLDPKKAAAFIFMMTGCVGKKRATVKMSTQPVLKWSGGGLLSNERTLKQTIALAGEEFDPGLNVRLPDVHTAGHIVKSAPDTFTAIKDGIRNNFGHAGPEFVQHLFRRHYTDDPAKLRSEIEAAAKGIEGPGSKGVTGQELRAARVFGVFQRAGEIAVEAGLLPAGTDVAGVVRKAWGIYRAGPGAQAIDPKEANVRWFHEAYAKARLTHFHDLTKDGIGSAGKPEYGYLTEKHICIFGDAFAQMVGNGQTFEAIFAALDAAGYVQHRAQRKDRPDAKDRWWRDIPGAVKGTRHIRLHRDKFEDDTPADPSEGSVP